MGSVNIKTSFHSLPRVISFFIRIAVPFSQYDFLRKPLSILSYFQAHFHNNFATAVFVRQAQRGKTPQAAEWPPVAFCEV
jgi:hypothetical protein